MLSPTTKQSPGGTPSRSAAARNRSGFGLAYATWSRVTTGVPEGTASMGSGGPGGGGARLVAIAHGTRIEDNAASSSRAPGSGRIWSSRPSKPRACDCRRRSARSSSSVIPNSRSSAFRKSPPLMPIRRWIRHTDRSSPSSWSASRHASTCWYTLSTSVPSRSNSSAGRAERPGLDKSESPPARHRARQGQLVRVLEVAPHGQPVRGPRHPGPQRLERALQVKRRRLALDVRIGGDDHLQHTLLTHPLEELRHMDLLGTDPIDRRDHPLQHEVQAAEL